MNLKLTPTRLRGTVSPPPSKSYAHRALIAAALAGGESSLTNLSDSMDISATRRCLAALFSKEELPLLDCGESGSTLRFLIPLSLVLKGGARFTGQGRLMERPQKPYYDLFEEKGITYAQNNGILTLQGSLSAGDYRLPGNVSSQFLTGLLYALPLLPGDSTITLTTELESRDYVEMTRSLLSHFGIRTEETADGWFVPGNQTYIPNTLTIEADWSQAAFFYAALGLGSSLDIQGMNLHSVQGDVRILPYCERLMQEGDVELDVSQCPDLVPPLAVYAALRRGTTRITNAARLRLKESDRLASVTEVLNALGGDVTEGADHLTVVGRTKLAGGVTVNSHNDHRIAMMAAIAATRCENPIVITDAHCVAKSYPNFWEDYAALGGILQEVSP